ncbi:hypothetical protein ASD97_34710 [Streptomyces sp. Root63]|nr:hypothetical protein ASD97_34710 [Streptomyces sp. Root63]
MPRSTGATGSLSITERWVPHSIAAKTARSRVSGLMTPRSAASTACRRAVLVCGRSVEGARIKAAAHGLSTPRSSFVNRIGVRPRPFARVLQAVIGS